MIIVGVIVCVALGGKGDDGSWDTRNPSFRIFHIDDSAVKCHAAAVTCSYSIARGSLIALVKSRPRLELQ